MTNKNYKIDRDNVYVGRVMKIFKNKKGHLNLNVEFLYRSMLYVPTEDNKASDLLYDTRDYPIFNKNDDIDYLKSNAIIFNSCNLAPLLKYF